MNKNISEVVAGVQRYAHQLDQYVRRHFPFDTLDRQRDPHTTGSLLRYTGNQLAGVHSGIVVNSFAGNYCYRVYQDGLRAPIICADLQHGSLSPFGSRMFGVIPPGSRVFFLRTTGSNIGWIVGAQPPMAVDPRLQLPDYLSMFSRGGPGVDAVHSAAMKLAGKGGLGNWSAGRPLDAIPGAVGFMAPTGVGAYGTDFMAALRADEDTGVWAYYEHRLLRIAGHRMQMYLPGRHDHHYASRGEFWSHSGLTPYYLWEGLGILQPGLMFKREFSAQETQIELPHYMPVEPQFDDQTPFHRLNRYSGYVGDLHSWFVVAPPPGETVWRVSGQTPAIGLAHWHVAPDGFVGLNTARGFSFRMWPAIASPKRICRPESPNADTAAGYKPAGIYGTGEEHERPAGLLGTPEDLAAATDDKHALDRWRSLRSFAQHTKEFIVTDEGAIGIDVAPPAFIELAGQPRLRPPTEVAVAIDHRQPSVPVRGCSAGIDVTPEGVPIIEGSAGERIAAVGGNIEVDCPGDFVVRPGRRFVVFAGQDMIIKARNGADISTTDGTIRVRAGANVEFMAEGGMLLESKQKSRDLDFVDRVGDDVHLSGIILKSASDIAAYGNRSLYLRTLNGPVLVDAASGQQPVRLLADSFLRYLSNESSDLFGSLVEGVWTTEASARWSATAALIDGNLGIGGQLAVKDSITAMKNITSVEGRIADQSGGEMQAVSSESADEARDIVRQLVDELQSLTRDFGDNSFAGSFGEEYIAPNLANDELIDAIGFSFRTTAQYGSAQFDWAESRWQKLARESDQTLAIWEEKPVAAGGQRTYPYPGAVAYEEPSLRLVDSILVDPLTGLGKDASDTAFKAPIVTSRRVPLNEGYLVIG